MDREKEPKKNKTLNFIFNLNFFPPNAITLRDFVSLSIPKICDCDIFIHLFCATDEHNLLSM